MLNIIILTDFLINGLIRCPYKCMTSLCLYSLCEYVLLKCILHYLFFFKVKFFLFNYLCRKWDCWYIYKKNSIKHRMANTYVICSWSQSCQHCLKTRSRTMQQNNSTKSQMIKKYCLSWNIISRKQTHIHSPSSVMKWNMNLSTSAVL